MLGLPLIVGGFLLYRAPLGNRRPHDPRNHCIVNVKGLATSAALYSVDHNDRFPLADAWMDATTAFAKSSGYSARRDLYRCPAIQKSLPTGHGYAFNRDMSSGLCEGAERPERTILIYDSRDLRRNANDPVSSLPNPARHQSRIGGPFNNVAYVDTHVRAVQRPPP